MFESTCGSNLRAEVLGRAAQQFLIRHGEGGRIRRLWPAPDGNSEVLSGYGACQKGVGDDGLHEGLVRRKTSFEEGNHLRRALDEIRDVANGLFGQRPPLRSTVRQQAAGHLAQAGQADHSGSIVQMPAEHSSGSGGVSALLGPAIRGRQQEGFNEFLALVAIQIGGDLEV